MPFVRELVALCHDAVGISSLSSISSKLGFLLVDFSYCGFAAPVAAACEFWGIFVQSIGLENLSSKLPGDHAHHCYSRSLMKLRVGVFSNYLDRHEIRFNLLAFRAIQTKGSWDFTPKKEEWSVILSPGFAVALFLCELCLCGLNAASYVAGEINEPPRMFPVLYY